MRRLLVIGNKLDRLPSIPWGQCESHNILDYQGLLFDCRKPWAISLQQPLATTLNAYLRSGHPAYVILPGGAEATRGDFTVKFIPYLTVELLIVKGATVRAVAPSDVFFNAYCRCLRGHEVVLRAITHHGAPWGWTHAVIDNVGRPVCGRYGNVRFLHAPAPSCEGLALKLIVADFQPEFEVPEVEPPPDWAKAVALGLPGITEIESRMSGLRNNISEFEEQLRREETGKQELERWVEMLWADGIPLQDRVREALEFLGFTTESENPTQHARDLVARHGTRTFLLEVTGSTGSINIDKGRQLLQWVVDSEDPGNVKGVLVGNAFRTEPPATRTQSEDRRFFTSKLEELAQRYRLALVDVRELFGLVAAKVEGKNVDLDGLCEDMWADGVIKFRMP